jgi:ParB-like chromosome segregation protein Spo0J
MNTTVMKLKEIKLNPSNPRVIKDEKFQQLVKSIKDFPQMLSIRPIVVNEDMVVLGGNMRLRACQEARLKEVPVIIANELTPEQQREFIIKDNIGFGQWDWDMLANEWDATELEEWGLETNFMNEDLPLEEVQESDTLEAVVVIGVNSIQDIDKLTDFYGLETTTLSTEMRNKLAKERKVYVFKPE